MFSELQTLQVKKLKTLFPSCSIKNQICNWLLPNPYTMVTLPRHSSMPHSSLSQKSLKSCGIIFSKDRWLLYMISSKEGMRSSGNPHSGVCLRILSNSIRLLPRIDWFIGFDTGAITKFSGACFKLGFSSHVIMERSFISIDIRWWSLYCKISKIFWDIGYNEMWIRTDENIDNVTPDITLSFRLVVMVIDFVMRTFV